MANPWEAFFDSHAPHYGQNPFTQATTAEVDFILDLFQPLPGSAILDLGCGTGRHAIELAKRGFHVTGVDISTGMLCEAEKSAGDLLVSTPWEVGEARPGVCFLKADAESFRSEGFLFDLVLCLCEGGLGLIGPGVDPVGHDLAIMRTAFDCLRPNGGFILTCMNGYATIRSMKDEDVAAGAFDPATMMAHYVNEWDLPEGKRAMEIHERLFIPPELMAMLRHVGFEVLHLWGGTAGEWGKRALKLDEVEMMAVCRKG